MRLIHLNDDQAILFTCHVNLCRTVSWRRIRVNNDSESAIVCATYRVIKNPRCAFRHYPILIGEHADFGLQAISRCIDFSHFC